MTIYRYRDNIIDEDNIGNVLSNNTNVDIDVEFIGGQPIGSFDTASTNMIDVINKGYTGLILIYSPDVIVNNNGDTWFNLNEFNISIPEYKTSIYYDGVLTSVEYQVAVDVNFKGIIEKVNKKDDMLNFISTKVTNYNGYYFRCRYISNQYSSDWSKTLKFITNILLMVEKPTIIVDGMPDRVTDTPTLRGSPFIAVGGELEHTSSRWDIADITGTIIYTHTSDVDLLTHTIPNSILSIRQTYIFKLTYYSGNKHSLTGEVMSIINPDIIIDIPILDIAGRPNNVDIEPVIQGSEFIVSRGLDIHLSTTWIIEDNTRTVRWRKDDDFTNLTSIKTPPNVLEKGKLYYFKAMYNGSQVSSRFGIISGTVDTVIYNNVWRPTTSIPVTIYDHQQSTLPNGDVLVSGGIINNQFSSRMFILNRETGSAREIDRMGFSRAAHVQLTLNNGEVFIVGGMSKTLQGSIVEVYNPITNMWKVFESMSLYLNNHTGSLLSNGNVIISGGIDNNSSISNGVFMFNFSTNKWEYVTELPIPMAKHIQVSLANNHIMFTGGISTNGVNDRSFIYSFNNNRWREVKPLPKPLYGLRATLFINNNVIVTGGKNIDISRNVYVYRPDDDTWRDIMMLRTGIYRHGISRSIDNRITITGGLSLSGAVNNTYIYI